MNTVYLLLGSNLGDRRLALARAVNSIGKTGKVGSCSPVYETAPWGNSGQPAFLNQAIELHTNFEAGVLMEELLRIEKTMGRERGAKYGPRTLDIDILLFNDEVISTPELTVPHPAMQDRRFVLTPLADIAADVVHPVVQKTISSLLADCTDHLAVTIYT
ncbi:MAG TPA: 2-amino-4-hydroxy-6-hydroxymethyldihydropteridine diphosphokinase [Chitinophagaceae bacterium]